MTKEHKRVENQRKRQRKEKGKAKTSNGKKEKLICNVHVDIKANMNKL